MRSHTYSHHSIVPHQIALPLKFSVLQKVRAFVLETIASDPGLQQLELVFLGLIIIPAYGLFSFGDAIIFNSIEFWGGSNPIRADGETPRSRAHARAASRRPWAIHTRALAAGIGRTSGK